MLSAIQPQTGERVFWEENLIHEIETIGEMTTSDAQGICMVHAEWIDVFYSKDFTPEATATYILAIS